MKNWKWTWVALAVVLYLSNDVSMRMVAVNVNFIAGSIVQALPLVLISGLGLARERGDGAHWKNYSILGRILLYGTMQVLMGNVLYFLAMRFGGLSIASPTVQSQAIWAVILGAVLLRETISRNGWAGVVCFAAGIAMITYFKAQNTIIASGWQWGVLFGILAGLSWSSGSVIQKTLFKQQVSQNTIFFYGTLFGIVLLTVLGLGTDPSGFMQSLASPATYKMLVPGLFSSIATWCFAKALRQIPVSTIIPILSVNILFNTIIGALGWGEYVNTGTIAGLLIAFVGILLSQNIRLGRSIKGYKEEAI